MQIDIEKYLNRYDMQVKGHSGVCCLSSTVLDDIYNKAKGQAWLCIVYALKIGYLMGYDKRKRETRRAS